jgi:hypothetical protein
VSGQEFILDELKNIRMGMRRLERDNQFGKDPRYREAFDHPASDEDFDYCMGDASNLVIKKAIDIIGAHPAVISVDVMELDSDHKHLRAKLSDIKAKDELEMLMRKISPKGHRNRHLGIRKNG